MTIQSLRDAQGILISTHSVSRVDTAKGEVDFWVLDHRGRPVTDEQGNHRVETRLYPPPLRCVLSLT